MERGHLKMKKKKTGHQELSTLGPDKAGLTYEKI